MIGNRKNIGWDVRSVVRRLSQQGESGGGDVEPAVYMLKVLGCWWMCRASRTLLFQ